MAAIILDSGTNKIQGDFDSATIANRTTFQTSTVNANTGINAVPNGTAIVAGWGAVNNSNPTNASTVQMLVNGTTDAEIISGINGSGTYLPLGIYTNNTQRLSITTTGAFVLGTGTSNYGTSGQVLTSSGNGVPTWTTPGMTLLGTITPTAVNSISLGSLTLTNYKAIFIEFNNLGVNLVAQLYINSSNAQTGGSVDTSVTSGLYGAAWVSLANGGLTGSLGADYASAKIAAGPTSITTASTTIYFRWAGTKTFTASGSITIYGVA
jgi:hypothetical protein